jgi:hypothetical protein
MLWHILEQVEIDNAGDRERENNNRMEVFEEARGYNSYRKNDVNRNFIL